MQWVIITQRTIEVGSLVQKSVSYEFRRLHPLGHNRTEVYHIGNDSWIQKDDYPYHKDISRAAILSIGQDFFIFGGQCANANLELDDIAKFSVQTQKWSHLGHLQVKRRNHKVKVVSDSEGKGCYQSFELVKYMHDNLESAYNWWRWRFVFDRTMFYAARFDCM